MSNGDELDFDEGSDLTDDKLEEVLAESEGISVWRGEMKDGSIKTQINIRPAVFGQISPLDFIYNPAADRMILAWKRQTTPGGGVSKAAGNGKCKR